MSEVAVIIVTRNNPVLLRHAIQKYQEHPAGVDCDFHIVDASSDDSKQVAVLTQQDLGNVKVQQNDRVEVNFDEAYHRLPDYKYYFFAHDDNVPIQDNWLVPFMEKMHTTGTGDEMVPGQYHSLPIGRVGATSHFWRDYERTLNYFMPCRYLRGCIEDITGITAPTMFKYADCDRILVSRECLAASQGFVTLEKLSHHLDKCKKHFDAELGYYDEGMYPKAKYPPGQYWNKLTLLSEFMNSIIPLMRGYRTVGVDSNGYLEQIHGKNVPWGHRYVAHFGAPNALAALAKHFHTDEATVKKKFNDRAFVLRTHQFFTNYYKDN